MDVGRLIFFSTLILSAMGQCLEEAVARETAFGLYTTDGAEGVTIEVFVRYNSLGSDRVDVCEVGLRMPHIDRVRHCLDNDVCPPGAQINLDFPIVNDFVGERGFPFPFVSMAAGFNVQGHPNGNYQEYREYWQACEDRSTVDTCDEAPSSWSWIVPHVDAHFFFLPDDEVESIFWEGFPTVPPPADIAAKCEDEPDSRLAAPTGFFSENDCIPHMGRHWAEDKLEPAEVFQFQPALIYGTYDGKPSFWEPMVSGDVFNWIRDNDPDQRATLSWPQPELYPEAGYFPTHYFLGEVTNSDDLIGNGRTVEVGFTNFVLRPRDPNAATALQMSIPILALSATLCAIMNQ
mmetsp:Transcript_33378/g.93667  ORF Transcript_33378/g.93667 Transcript_33378/m.93667 type:complete len:347 (+) Transcript_33378:143-1183(+)|eukprot:CAMPEP_0119132682 /NCGR_PEP_ID=MMETSP1310-20130426/12032_1 /TAXON_ID=464262 /ORGANISM="Genus nov. species nov., Strain RCC2339" /LENGTH=346 /DNA_ID=CAMNT_0007123327 /DNA_START=114 /DNA_END=1154 /DNA_ORIENTATION=-